jgi:hypothetical protein
MLAEQFHAKISADTMLRSRFGFAAQAASPASMRATPFRRNKATAVAVKRFLQNKATTPRVHDRPDNLGKSISCKNPCRYSVPGSSAIQSAMNPIGTGKFRIPCYFPCSQGKPGMRGSRPIQPHAILVLDVIRALETPH